MNYFTSKQMDSIFNENFAFIKMSEIDHVLHITLDREEKRNALHPKMIDELAYAFQYANMQKDVRVIVLKAEGNVFCAGGDLKAMRGDVEPHKSSIIEPDKKILIGELFNKVYKPIIAQVEGRVFAGGFLILAGCQYVVAADHLEFAMPEVKRGLFPMQVMASLLTVMPRRKVIDWCMRGYTISAQQAKDWGILTHVVEKEKIESIVEELTSELTANSPKAISLGLEALDHISPKKEEHQYLFDMLQKAIQSKDGQEGLKAFAERRKPEWTGE